MSISVTFRHMDPTQAINAYALSRIEKLRKLFREPMTAKVTLAVDGKRQGAEVRITSGSLFFEAKEVGENVYACIDAVVDKLARQVKGTKGVAAAKARRRGETVRVEVDEPPPAPAKKKVAKKKAAKKVGKSVASARGVAKSG